jgi:hypothetical protein
MPSNPRKRQKQLEKRAAKRKQKKHTEARTHSAGLPGQLTAASKCPVLYCWITEFQGIASVHLSRQFPNGQVAAGNILVDRYCLGVKDAFAEVGHRVDYEEKYQRKRSPDLPPPRPLPPADARKLIEGAVEYARGIGFEPSPDYETVMLLFGDIDAATSTAQFEFGQDGKPYFFAGQGTPRSAASRSSPF